MLFGSPVKLIIVLCTRNGDREKMVSSWSECINRNLGTLGVFVEVDKLDLLVEKLGTIFRVRFEFAMFPPQSTLSKRTK